MLCVHVSGVWMLSSVYVCGGVGGVGVSVTITLMNMIMAAFISHIRWGWGGVM